MRPKYETALDRAKEERVAKLVAQRLGPSCYALKMPPLYSVDYALLHGDGRIARWLEVKCRNNTRNRYPTYMLALTKVVAMNCLTQGSGISAILAVEWTDGIGVGAIPPAHELEVAMGGRADRADPQDVEPVALIPIHLFNPI